MSPLGWPELFGLLGPRSLDRERRFPRYVLVLMLVILSVSLVKYRLYSQSLECDLRKSFHTPDIVFWFSAPGRLFDSTISGGISDEGIQRRVQLGETVRGEIVPLSEFHRHCARTPDQQIVIRSSRLSAQLRVENG